MPKGKGQYHVDWFGSHPDLDNDDCWTGSDYRTKAAAKGALNRLLKGRLPPNFSKKLGPTLIQDTTHIMLDGPDINEVHRTPWASKIEAHREREKEHGDVEWRREQAMQAGMAHGTRGYNEAMGYDEE